MSKSTRYGQLVNAQIPDIFCERLRAAREMRQLSQAALAEKVGIPASSVGHFEGGGRKPSFDNLRSLANALEVTTDYLLGRADEPVLAKDADPLFMEFARLPDHDRDLAREILRVFINRAKAA